MKTKILASGLGLGLPLALMLTPNVVRAETVPADQAQAHVGKVVTIEGAVSGIHKSNSGVTFLDIGGQFPNNAFAAVIFKDDAGKFPDISAFGGKTVEVTGSIRLYQGRPEIILNDPAQITAK
jgi:hypothetical protein